MTNDDYRRTLIGPTAQPRADEQHIVSMVPRQVARSLVNRALWIGIGIGAVLVAIAVWLWSKLKKPDQNSPPERRLLEARVLVAVGQ